VLPTSRLTAHTKTSQPVSVVSCTQSQARMSSVDEMGLLTVTASGLLAACSLFDVRKRKSTVIDLSMCLQYNEADAQ